MAELDDDDERARLLERYFDYKDWQYPMGYGQKPVRCPLHNDRQASASIHTGRGLFHCNVGCTSGDVITLIMSEEGVDYAGALKFITDNLDANVGGNGRANGRTGGTGSKSGKKYVPTWRRSWGQL